MIIDTLVLENYRPFAGRQKVVFAPPGACNVTLLIGGSGAGNSTLIRLICHLFSDHHDNFDALRDRQNGGANPGSAASLIVKIGNQPFRASRHNTDLPPESGIYDLRLLFGAPPDTEPDRAPLSSGQQQFLLLREAMWQRQGRRYDDTEGGPLLLDDPFRCLDLRQRQQAAELFGHGGRQTIIALRPQDYREMLASGWTQYRRVGRLYRLLRTSGNTQSVSRER